MKALVKISIAATLGICGIWVSNASAANSLTEIQRNNPDAIHAPFGVYSHAVSVPAGSELVFIAGQTGLDKEGNTVEGGIKEQTRQALANLNAILEAEGLTEADLVNMTIYLTDIDNLPGSSEERRAFFKGDKFPAGTLLIVASLAAPDLLIEIDAVAARNVMSSD